MAARMLPNGNLLVPAVAVVDGQIVTGLKEVGPGSTDYEEWIGSVERTGAGREVRRGR